VRPEILTRAYLATAAPLPASGTPDCVNSGNGAASAIASQHPSTALLPIAFWLVLGGLTAVAAVLRFWSLDWANGNEFHIDENTMNLAAWTLTKPWDPHYFT
jgi:hypothetical protein